MKISKKNLISFSRASYTVYLSQTVTTKKTVVRFFCVFHGTIESTRIRSNKKKLTKQFHEVEGAAAGGCNPVA